MRLPSTPQPEMTIAPSRPSHLRQANARGLLRLLKEHNPCSKADLVRLSGLSAPTVTSAVSHLESLGLVENLGEGESSGGRPPEMLRFNATHGYVAAADIGGTRLRMLLADLNGRIVTQWATQFTEKQRSPKAVCGLIHEGLKVMCHEASASIRKVLHITAGAPGITNTATGVVLSAPNLTDWKNVPLRSMLERELGIAAQIENDTNLAAVGEHWRGSATGVDDFVFIALGTGVGAGVYINGRLHHGANWSAGEIGYAGIRGMSRQRLEVQSPGQLESSIGGLGIETEWTRLLHRERRANTVALEHLRATEIFDLAVDGDRLAIQLIRYTAQILSDCIVELSLGLDPAVVILGGGVGSHPELCRVTEKLLSDNEFAKPQVRASSLGTQAQLHGALSISLSATEAHLLS
ncbi:MAG: ROK family transcriptional regulator [Edaphobacter sp.]|uniref:ROK family transcriptional regulator n=1 Tax=Edaphobacter sp. TaxID=1934404 RepID=UPI0023843938|nr:ROK family transcriptional regulator [Edaphobacter sp.]MDE1175776.1 ROK family transcriptional regulator [Edaphobacter sp.]